MILPDIDKIPDAISRQALAKLLSVHPRTLVRAERSKDLIANHPNSRVTIYFKSDVLRWLTGRPYPTPTKIIL
jgi:hypothetical protein